MDNGSDFVYSGEMLKHGIANATSDMFEQVRRHSHLSLHHLVYIKIAHCIRQIVRQFCTRGIGLESKIDTEMGADGAFLLEATVIGIELHPVYLYY